MVCLVSNKNNQQNIIVYNMKEEVQHHILKRYDLLKKIGSGAYGHVWKVKDKQSGEILALKKIFDAFQHSTDAQRTYRQIMFLQEFNHQNIIKLHNVIKADNDKDIYLVFEYMEIDLHSVIRQNILKDKHKKYIIYQIAKAIKYLHSTDLIHRDLKPSNVLINSQCLVKVCDFGLIRSLDQELDEGQQRIMTEYVATRWYRAPQILLGSNSYSKGVDVWSFGCLIAELFRGKPLFAGTSTLNQIQRVLMWTGYPSQTDIQSLRSDVGESMLQNLRGVKCRNVKQWIPGIDDIVRDLLNKMLVFNPNKRYTIDQVLKHPYLEQFHDPSTEKICEHRIVPNISENRKLSMKEYRSLIYNQINRRNQSKRSTSKDLDRCDIRCQISQSNRPKRKSVRSIIKPEDEEDSSLDKPYGAKTLYIQNSRKTPFYATPGKQATAYISNHMSFLPQRNKLSQMFPRTKFLTEAKQQSFNELKGRPRIYSVSKKNSLKPSSKDISKDLSKEFSNEKRMSFEGQIRRKSVSTNSGTGSKNGQLLVKRYLNRSKLY